MEVASENRKKGGRPVGRRTIRAIAADHAIEAVGVLARIARNVDEPTADRVHAAGLILGFAGMSPIVPLETRKEP